MDSASESDTDSDRASTEQVASYHIRSNDIDDQDLVKQTSKAELGFESDDGSDSTDTKNEINAKNELDTARRLKRNADRRIRKKNHREFIAQQTARENRNRPTTIPSAWIYRGATVKEHAELLVDAINRKVSSLRINDLMRNFKEAYNAEADNWRSPIRQISKRRYL
jgi:hypothetical protein